MVIIGGGYIAAEYGHFFSAMGSKVAIIGRNRQFLPEEEPEVSALAKRELQKHLTLLTDHEVQKVTESSTGMKTVVAVNRENGKPVEFEAETVLVAAGRGSNSDILHPEKAGIKTDDEGWIIVDDYLETSQPNVWALGDADGRYLFKHVANHEALTVYLNAVGKKKVKVDYHAVPHAVFMVPEVASVGLKEKEAVEKYGKSNLLIGVERFQDTAKGLAMDVTDCFAKIILESNTLKILGAHIIGPCASLLIQEVINLMYTPTQDAEPILQAMHIHPALSEVVQRAVGARVPVDHYHHMMEGHYKLPLE
jgi:dihydrolipoamide dehydrogenase